MDAMSRVLEEIRDAARDTNARLDQTNARLEGLDTRVTQMDLRLSTQLMKLETKFSEFADLATKFLSGSPAL